MNNPIINTVFSETICQYRSDAAILADNELRFSRTASPPLAVPSVGYHLIPQLARSELSEYFCPWSHTLMEHLLKQTSQVDVAAIHVETPKEYTG
ncbi:MAG: hypothetical protein ACLQUT_13115 [Thermoleophilia bacterium]